MTLFPDEWRDGYDDWKTTNPADEYLGTGRPPRWEASFVCRRLCGLCGRHTHQAGREYPRSAGSKLEGLCTHCYGECRMCGDPTIRPEPLCPTCRKIHLEVMP